MSATYTMDVNHALDVKPLSINGIRLPSDPAVRLASDFSRAIGKAQASSASGDRQGYTSAIEDFLHRLQSSSDLQGSSVGGYHVRTLCLLERYDEARARLPKAIPHRLGGQGKDDTSSIPKDAGAFGVSVIGVSSRDECAKSLNLAVLAKDWHAAGRLLAIVRQQHPRFLADLSTESGNGDNGRQTQADVAAIYEHNDGLSESLSWYLRARNKLHERKGQIHAGTASVHALHLMNNSDVFDALVRVCLRFARMRQLGLSTSNPADFGLTGIDWGYQALEFAEQGRAAVLLDALAQNRSGSDSISNGTIGNHTAKKDGYFAWNGIASSSPFASPASTVQSLHDGRSSAHNPHSPHARGDQADKAVDLQVLRQHLPKEVLALHYTVTDEGTEIFAMSNAGLLRVAHSTLDRKGLRDLVLAYQQEVGQPGRPAPEAGDGARGIGQSLLLARHLLTPVADLIAANQHIVFLPAHQLKVFPLCVLPFEGEPLMMRKTISQVPSLAALRQTSLSNTARPHMKPSVFVNQHTAVPLASVAAAVVADGLGARTANLRDMDATTLHGQFKLANLVHIGTHAIEFKSGYQSAQGSVHVQDPKYDPQVKHDQKTNGINGLPHHENEVLHISQLAHTQTSAAAVVLSACLATRGGSDMLALSHAILQSGAQSYIGALWTVADFTTMLMVTLLYRELDAGQRTTSIAECLRRAQLQFYKLTPERALSILREAESCWMRIHNSQSLQDWEKTWARFCMDALQQATKQLDTMNFKDPHHWAAWVVVGNGDARLIHEPPTPSRPRPPVDMVALHKIHSIDSAGIRPSARTPSISLTTPTAMNPPAELAAEETRPPLPPRHAYDRRASEPVKQALPMNLTGSITRRPVPSPPSRPSSIASGGSPHFQPAKPVQHQPGRTSPGHPQHAQYPQRHSPSPSRTPTWQQTPTTVGRGQHQPAPPLGARPPHAMAAHQTRNAMVPYPQHQRPQHHPASPPQFPGPPQAHRAQQYQTQHKFPPPPTAASTTTQKTTPSPHRSPNLGPSPAPTPENPKLAKKPGRFRRMMQHPGGKIAVRVGTGLLVGGVLGAQVGGIVDSWAGGAEGAGAAMGGGGMGMGMLGMLGGEDGEGGEEGGGEEEMGGGGEEFGGGGDAGGEEFGGGGDAGGEEVGAGGGGEEFGGGDAGAGGEYDVGYDPAAAGGEEAQAMYDGGMTGGEEYDVQYGGDEYGAATMEDDMLYQEDMAGYGGDAGYVDESGADAGYIEDSMAGGAADAGYVDETATGGADAGYADQTTADTTTDTGGGGGGCIEDDPLYSSMAVNGGYNVQY